METWYEENKKKNAVFAMRDIPMADLSQWIRHGRYYVTIFR